MAQKNLALYVFVETMRKGKRRDPTAAQKVRLITEVGARCPWCEAADPQGVWHFHHIDGKAWNTVLGNLIAVCPTHHAKIERGDIPRAEVQRRKRQLSQGKAAAKKVPFAFSIVPMRHPRREGFDGLI